MNDCTNSWISSSQNISLRQNHSEGPTARASDSVNLLWGVRILISNKSLLGYVDAADPGNHTL